MCVYTTRQWLTDRIERGVHNRITDDKCDSMHGAIWVYVDIQHINDSSSVYNDIYTIELTCGECDHTYGCLILWKIWERSVYDRRTCVACASGISVDGYDARLCDNVSVLVYTSMRTRPPCNERASTIVCCAARRATLIVHASLNAGDSVPHMTSQRNRHAASIASFHGPIPRGYIMDMWRTHTNQLTQYVMHRVIRVEE